MFLNAIFSDYRKCIDGVELSKANGVEFGPEIHLAVLALEDRRFLVHPGVDIPSIFRALIRRFQKRHSGGASTIGQQFVRTVTNRRERKISRKVREIILSVAVLRHCSKSDVLNAYLSVAYTGTGLIGLVSAANHLWGKSITDLDINQVSILAASLKYPIPKKQTEEWRVKINTRAGYCIRQLQRHDWVRNWPISESSIFFKRERSKSYTSALT